MSEPEPIETEITPNEILDTVANCGFYRYVMGVFVGGITMFAIASGGWGLGIGTCIATSVVATLIGVWHQNGEVNELIGRKVIEKNKE